MAKKKKETLTYADLVTMYRQLAKDHLDLIKAVEKGKTAELKVASESATKLHKQNLMNIIKDEIKRENLTIEQLKDIEKNQKYVQENAQKVKQLQETLRPWANFIEELTEKAFKHGHSIATFKRVKQNGKNAVIGNKIIVIKPKMLKSLFVHGIPLGDLLFDYLPEQRAKVEEICEECGITVLSEKEKRKLAVDMSEARAKAKLEKEGEKELKLLDDWVDEQVAKAKPEQRTELRQHLQRKVKARKQGIRSEYGLKQA